MDSFEAALLKAIKPLARVSSEALIAGLEADIERLFPNGGFTVSYRGNGIWRAEVGKHWIGCSSLVSALGLADQLAKDIKKKGVILR